MPPSSATQRDQQSGRLPFPFCEVEGKQHSSAAHTGSQQRAWAETCRDFISSLLRKASSVVCGWDKFHCSVRTSFAKYGCAAAQPGAPKSWGSSDFIWFPLVLAALALINQASARAGTTYKACKSILHAYPCSQSLVAAEPVAAQFCQHLH